MINKSFNSFEDCVKTENTYLGPFYLKDLLNENGINTSYKIKNAWINTGGYQSWSPVQEVKPGTKQLALSTSVIKQFNSYIQFPNTKAKESKRYVIGHFVVYLRWNDFYLCFASTGNINNELPPVQFIFDRKKDCIFFELADTGKSWAKDELKCSISIFTAENYFELTEKLEQLFGSMNPNRNYATRFNQIAFLGQPAAGWESWYNRYANIDEKCIIEDLNGLSVTENLISKGDFSAPVFQIDDGWEIALGDWNLNTKKFPSGFKAITNQIEEKGYIPGLWVAPFIIDYRSSTARNHPDWLLRNASGDYVMAGWNPLWGAKKGNEQPSLSNTFFCLDLSIKEVQEYLKNLMEKVINDWGFRYIKLDFLYAGMLNGDFKNKGAAYQWYINAIKILTEITTDKNSKNVAYLGCGIPFENSFNYFPLSRIGCDTYEHWENKLPKLIRWNGRNSAYLNVMDTISRAHWNKIIYANDPDVVFIREDNCTLTAAQKKLIAFVDSAFGSQIMYSDAACRNPTPSEKALTQELLKTIRENQNKKFGYKFVDTNKILIFTEDKTYSKIINLKKSRNFIL